MPVSIALPDSSLYQPDKAGFRNYIMKSSKSVSSFFPHIAKWFIDGMAAMRSIKPRSTYIEWFIDLLKYITQPANENTHSLDNIMDKNIPKSVKQKTHTQRSTNPWPSVHVIRLDKKMPQTDGWERLLNADNKNNLVALFVYFLKSPESEKYCKYYVCLLPKHLNFHKKTIWFIKGCFAIWHHSPL